jgi:nucleoside-diphosphate-sugar epimerase
MGIELSQGDITDKESMRSQMKNVDGVFHIAGWYKVGLKDRSMAEAINVKGTRNVLELMKELEVPKGVYTSTLAVFSDTRGRVVDETYSHNGPWLSEYDRTKWIAHYKVALPMMEDGLRLVIVQPGVTYGPGDRGPTGNAFLQYLQQKLSAVPRRTAYCWAHVDDTAAGHILAMEKGKTGESYIIGGPVHTLIEVFEIAERITGIPLPKCRPGPGFLNAMAGLMSVLEKFISVPESYSSEYLRSIAGVTYLGSSEKARRELGFESRPLEEGVRETLLHEMRLLRSDEKNNQEETDA